MEQLQRKTFIPRGINRSNPVSQPEDGHCHEIVNMRYKDNAWRRTKEKSLANAYDAMPALLNYPILKRHPLMDDNFLVGIKDDGKLYMIDLDAKTESELKDYEEITGLIVEGTTNPEAIWGCSGVDIVTEKLIYSGDVNTDNIIAGCATVDIAARKAREYTTGGYEDWYLPSLSELRLIWENKGWIGNFSEAYYWTSTQAYGDNTKAYAVSFLNDSTAGQPVLLDKTSTARVRAIRQFNLLNDVYTPKKEEIYQGGRVLLEAKQITDITFFGRLMIVASTNDKDIFKLREDNKGFVEMPNIPEGSHLISDSGDAEQSIELEAKSAGNEAQIAKINMLLYEDKELGKFEGHCFFRFAWRLWDNSLIHHSAIHYYHVGINDGLLRFDTEANDPVVVDKYRTAKPKVRHSFNSDELTALEQYKDVITGLVLFMTDPVSTYDISDELDGWVNTIDNLYVPAINENIEDLLKEAKGFYKIHEMSLQELIESMPMDDGLYLTDIDIDAGNVHNIESNERLPLDNYTNHKIKGAVTYDYNSMLHLGNVKTILSDPKNIGKYAPAFGIITDPIDELVYGANMQTHPDLFGEGGETPENVRVSVQDADLIQTASASDFVLAFNNNESDPAACYDATTGVYTVKSGNSGIYKIEFSGVLEPIGAVGGGIELVLAFYKNSTEIARWSVWIDESSSTTLVTFNVSHINNFNEGDQITVRSWAGNSGSQNRGNPSVFIIDRTTSLVQINYNPVIQVELDTEEGTKIVTKEYEAAESFLNGITGYYNSDDGYYYLMFKEVISYPDLRARKVRIGAKSNTTDAYYLFKTYDLVQHPYLDFAYSKPMLLADKNYYYVPQKILIPQQFNQFVPATENRIINDKNRVQVSEINNPWVYPAINSYRIGTSSNEVLQIATMSEPMSVGQYGESPLMVFTSQGIFNMMQGQQGILYASIHRLNIDVLLQKNALVELGGAIVYATSNGLFVLAGSQREEISKAIEGSVTGISNRIDHWKMPAQVVGEVSYYISDHFSDIDFIAYMQDAMLAYDNKEMEIFAIKPEADYSYVYRIETKMWHKISESYRKIIRRADNSFEALGDDGLLYNLSEEDTTGTRDAGLLTRPMLFTDSNLKKVERMVARFINENSGGATAVNLYVSLDGWSFVWLSGATVSQQAMNLSNLIIKRTHTSARYFMVSMGLTASERFELTGFDLDVLYRHQQKLR